MNILIIQLSDIHLKASGNTIFEKTEALCRSIRSNLKEYEACFVIYSGDIAYSGQEAEYEVALDLISIVDQELKSIPTISTHEFLFVPGNHDCDLSKDDLTRQTLSRAILSQPEEFDETSLEQCLKVQSAYFNFTSTLFDAGIDSVTSRLISTKVFNVGGHQVVFDLINTSWLSKRHEEPGKLLGPPDKLLAEIPPIDEFSLRVCVLHHPLHWIKPETARSLRDVIETQGDIIITGHEHTLDKYTRAKPGENGTDYIEGGVLQDSDNPDLSAFNLIEASLTEKTYTCFEEVWDGKNYVRSEAEVSQPFKRHGASDRKRYALSVSFCDSYLRNPGAQYTHPRKDSLRFDDLYTPPDFRRFSNRIAVKQQANQTLSGTRAFTEIKEINRVVISGNEKVGKTSAVKYLFWSHYSAGLCPLIINGDALTSSNPEKFERVLHNAFSDQYENRQSFTEFKSLDLKERVLFIDDFHQSTLNISGRQALLRHIEKFFGKVVVIGDDALRVEQISGDDRYRDLFKGYTHFQILEFGFMLREKLVSRWLLIGGEDSLDEIDYAVELKRRTSAISVILGKNVVPSYPLFILVILQQMEAGITNRTATGSYGYFYESLITQSLSGALRSKEIDKYYNLIAELAYQLYNRNTRTISKEDLGEFVAYYNREYKLALSAHDVENRLLKAHILFFRGRELLRFQYKYVYYYFIARHAAHNLSVDQRSEFIRACIDTIHSERSANIVIFLSYLSRDSGIISMMIEGAKQIYSNVLPCNFDSHVSELSKLQDRVPGFILPHGDPERRREASLQARDASLTRTDEHGVLAFDEEGGNDVDGTVDEILAVNRAFKSMQVLGQVVRNFAGSLRGETKSDLTDECISIGLRTINYMFGLLQENLSGVVSYVKGRLKERANDVSDDELERRSKILLFFLCESAASSLTRRIATEIGAPDLSLTFKELVESNPTAAHRLIDVAVKMDNKVDFPGEEVVSLGEHLDGNIFAKAVLCELVATHFYLFRVPAPVRQRVCNRLGINIGEERVQDISKKRLGH